MTLTTSTEVFVFDATWAIYHRSQHQQTADRPRHFIKKICEVWVFQVLNSILEDYCPCGYSFYFLTMFPEDCIAPSEFYRICNKPTVDLFSSTDGQQQTSSALQRHLRLLCILPLMQLRWQQRASGTQLVQPSHFLVFPSRPWEHWLAVLVQKRKSASMASFL